MIAELEPYRLAVLCAAATAGLHFVQLLIADVLALRRRHTPGTPVTGDHDDPLFRAVRAHANTTENLATFAVLLAAAIVLTGPAAWVNAGAALFFGARLAHMSCYYLDLRILRSVAFVVGLLGQGVVLAAALRAAF